MYNNEMIKKNHYRHTYIQQSHNNNMTVIYHIMAAWGLVVMKSMKEYIVSVLLQLKIESY